MAYDFTYRNLIGAEHTTAVNGNGSNPRIKDIMEVAKGIGIKAGKVKVIAEEIEEWVRKELGG